MHECPDCGQACDCDMEDTWWDDAFDCNHVCDDDDDDGFSYGPVHGDEPDSAVGQPVDGETKS